MEKIYLTRLVLALTIIILTGGFSQAPVIDAATRGPEESIESSEDGAISRDDSIDAFIPSEGELFNKEAIDEDALSQMDCHLRNVDYCYAGILGTAQRMIPESDSELEMRCDEMRAASSCMAIYNDRCATFRVMGALMPMSQSMGISRQSLPNELSELELPSELLTSGTNLANQTNIRLTDLIGLCEPSQKGTKVNRMLRNRLYSIGRCINARLPQLRPCIEDLKTAVQLVFEPQRSLPLKPSCCAIDRFRTCASKALDSVCGISSFNQLEAALASASNNMLGTSVMDRVCKQAAAKDPTPCDQLLPQSGLKAPHRRGRKASKLAKALDLMSF